METRILNGDEILQQGDVVYRDGEQDIIIAGLQGEQVRSLAYYKDGRIRVERRVDEVIARELAALRAENARLLAECEAAGNLIDVYQHYFGIVIRAETIKNPAIEYATKDYTQARVTRVTVTE